ncbi:hypothetical protein HWC53_gp094 [Bacillus phage vB_BmeM-Goe8]|uniref:Uncharacterized protein n=1 Tax=Bacillus phage vB_BmeM-Goe8 TaxID=2593638 RepID=A0A516KN38_9CAUD|nr:hypothetical protein HWC53_gp094 [Bacillus phage vB_BmeM-Goe8]QDP42995.1 hypothetical protein Goe8_c02220 [Bacillus phage vB_BmeM-Goe8]
MNNKEARKKLEAICSKYVGAPDIADTLVRIMRELHDILKDKISIEDWIVSKMHRFGSSVIGLSGYGDLMVVYSDTTDIIYKIEANEHIVNKLFPIPKEQLPSIEEAFKELLNKYTKLATRHIYDTCLFDSVEELSKLKKELEKYEEYIK